MTASEAQPVTETHSMDTEGTLNVPSFSMKFSDVASQGAREAVVAQNRAELAWRRTGGNALPGVDDLRRRVDEHFTLPLLKKQLARWGAQVEKRVVEIDGVYCEIFTPRDGVPERNKERVLINVHGGGFQIGARTMGELESLPIAGLGEIPVISVDYRMAPEHHFPAATEDLEVVYKHLLRDHPPNKIGIYGSSAGAILAAQAVPWLLERGLPLPRAIGMFGCTGQLTMGGDSASLARYVFGDNADAPDVSLGEAMSYFAGADLTSELVAPVLWPDVAKQFPPSLLITGTRAHEMSAVVDAHNRLTLAGAQSRLHIWDGLGHCFYLDADIPESHEVERIIVDFFDQALAG